MDNVPAVINQAIEAQKLQPENVNLMLPSQTFGSVLGQYDKVTMEVVKIDPNPDNGGVFEIDGKKALGKIPLQKIASALSIIWDPDHTGVVEDSRDRCRARATGAMRKPNGEWVTITEEKTIDLSSDEEAHRLAIEEKAEKGNFEGKVTEWGTSKNGKKYPAAFEPWESEEQKTRAIDRAVRKALLQRRKFKAELAMTGAKNRVIRAFIGIKTAYTDAELQKPFAFPRVSTDTDKLLSDPATRQQAIDRMTGSVGDVFGHGGAQHEREVQALSAPEDPSEDPEEDNIDDTPFGDENDPEDAGSIEEQLRDKLRDLLEFYDWSKAQKAAQAVEQKVNDTSLTATELQEALDKTNAFIEAQGLQKSGVAS